MKISALIFQVSHESRSWQVRSSKVFTTKEGSDEESLITFALNLPNGTVATRSNSVILKPVNPLTKGILDYSRSLLADFQINVSCSDLPLEGFDYN